MESNQVLYEGLDQYNCGNISSAIKNFKLYITENTPLSAKGLAPLLKHDIVPLLMEILKYEDKVEFLSGAAWITANIAAEFPLSIIFPETLGIFVHLLIRPSDDDVHEQALWALGNLAPRLGDLAPQYSHGVLPALISFVSLLNEHSNSSMLKNASWALSNFCMETPSEQVIPAFVRLIQLSDDEHVLADAWWIISHNTSLMPGDLTKKVVENLNHSSPLVVSSALRVVGNIVAKAEQPIMVLINVGAHKNLCNLLAGNYSDDIKKAACWTISNIIAEGKDLLKEVLDAGIIEVLVNIIIANMAFEKKPAFVVRQEAAWAIANATHVASTKQIETLSRKCCVAAFFRLLDCRDPVILEVCLAGIQNMMTKSEDSTVIDDIEAYHLGVWWFMSLREAHWLSRIRQKAKNIMYSQERWKDFLKDYIFVEDDNLTNRYKYPVPCPPTVCLGIKRPDPSPCPFPIKAKMRVTPGVGGLGGDIFWNAYLEDTRPSKRGLKWEETPLSKDVRVRFYRGKTMFEGCPMHLMPYVDELSGPVENIFQLNFDMFSENRSEFKEFLSKLGFPADHGGHEKIARKLYKSIDVFKTPNGLACLDIYKMEIAGFDEHTSKPLKFSDKHRALLFAEGLL